MEKKRNWESFLEYSHSLVFLWFQITPPPPSFSLSLTILLEFIYRLLENCIGKTNLWRNIFLKRITTVNGFWAEIRGVYWFCQIIYYNQGHASVFQNFAFLDFLIIISCKLKFVNSESFYEYGQQWVIFFSFFSSFFFFFFFTFLPLFKDTAQKSNSFPHMSHVSINEGTLKI